MDRQVGLSHTSTCVAAVCIATVMAASPAQAGGDIPRHAPRIAVTIGDASVVLVSANNSLYAFVDQLADNAPVAGSALTVHRADGSGLTLTRVADGQFVAPFDRGGHLQDIFTVSLVSPAGTGEGLGEIGYSELVTPELPVSRSEQPANATIAWVTSLWWAKRQAPPCPLNRPSTAVSEQSQPTKSTAIAALGLQPRRHVQMECG